MKLTAPIHCGGVQSKRLAHNAGKLKASNRNLAPAATAKLLCQNAGAFQSASGRLTTAPTIAAVANIFTAFFQSTGECNSSNDGTTGSNMYCLLNSSSH